MSNHVATTPSWLTSVYLQNLLQTMTKDENIEIKNFKMEAGSKAGDSYAGQVFRIHLEYNQQNETKTKSVIAKAIPQTELSKELTKGGFDMYQTEIKMMSTLPLLCNELAAKGIKERIYPYLYKLDIDNNAIFMEDLKAEGYVMVDRRLFLDLNHILVGMRTLAQMHASSYLLFKKDPTHKSSFLGCLHTKNKGSVMEKFTEASFSYLLRFIDGWPISEEDKNIFRTFKGKLYDLSTDNYERKDSSFNVLSHGDYTIRNMMFTYKDGKINSIKVFDFQACNYNSIGLDINYFLFTSGQNYVIVEHLEDVFRTYYDTFVSITGEIEGFTVDTVRKEFIERLGFGFEVALSLRAVMHADKPADLDAYVTGRDSDTNIEMFKNPTYISDIVRLLPLFKEHGIFK